MHSSGYSHWHDAAYWGLLLVACVVFYWMNALTPFKEDDMLHSLVMGDLTHVNTLGDLLHSWRNKFFIVNGRSSDMIAELYCGLLGKPLFDVCNTLMFGLLTHVISLLATGRQSVLAQAMWYACIGTCYPVPGETLLWLAGSCNYLWTITSTLWLLYYLLHHSSNRPGWVKGILLMLAAAVAGAGNEAMSFGFAGAMVLYYLAHRKSIDRTVVACMAGYIMGALLIMASPAAWERASGGGIAMDLPLLDLLYSRCVILGEKMVRFIIPLAAVAIGIAVLLLKGAKTLGDSVWPYLLAMLLLVLFALGWIPERPYAPLVTLSLIITVMAADTVLHRWRPLRGVAIAACLAVSVYTFGRGVQVLSENKAHVERVVKQIRQAPAQAILRECPFKRYSRFLYPLPMKSDWFFTNEYIWRAYFDKENVQFVSDSVYERFHRGRLLNGAVEMPFTSDRPALTGPLLGFPDQDYMVMPLAIDTLPTPYQVGKAFWNDTTHALSDQERDFRHSHALQTSSDAIGYYPLRYNGKVLMVLPLVSDKVSRLEILLDYEGEEMVNIYRKGSNPAGVKAIE